MSVCDTIAATYHQYLGAGISTADDARARNSRRRFRKHLRGTWYRHTAISQPSAC